MRTLLVLLVALLVSLAFAVQRGEASSSSWRDDANARLTRMTDLVAQLQAEIDALSGIVAGVPDPAPNREVLFGAYVHNAPWNMADLDAFEAAAGRPVSILHFGHPWEQAGKMQRFPATTMSNIVARGSTPMLNWGSQHLGKGPEQPDYKLTEITSGRYDDYITTWARDAKAWGHPFYIRFNHEMDGRWLFPWSVQLNGNRPEDFVPMWRHVHDIFTREGATNIAWVWCPNTKNINSVPFEQLYPGDAYVDWTCLDGYNSGTGTWRLFSEVFRGHEKNPYDSYGDMVRLAPSKPMMLGEWASGENQTGTSHTKAGWIRDALQIQIPENFPQIRAVIWFNNDTKASQGVYWKITSSTSARAAFAESIQHPAYR